MTTANKKLFLAIAILIIGSAWLLARQIITARSITIKTVNMPLVSPVAIDLPITPADPLLGNPGAPLTIVIFGDLADASTRSLLSTTINFIGDHLTAVRLIFKPTLSQRLLGSSSLAHQALWCVSSSNQQFWALLKNLLDSPNLTEDQLKARADKLRLNGAQLLTCAKLPATEQAVINTGTALRDLGIATSPAFFANNKQVNMESGVNIEQMLTTFTQE
ncbi:MAG: thioredoxin domain-containing protein [Candidatus Magasanikbacteria bacterium]|nr:thioredoxin domain-containing protein [Candidatus Magasanikbacteria bacterium]